MASSSAFWAQRFAGLLSSHPVGMFPAGTIEQAKRVLADSIAAMAAGSQLPEIAPLGRHLVRGGPSTLVGLRGTSGMEDAAFFNAVAATASEMDEGHYPAGGHPGIHVVTPALAAAEALGASGKALIDAIIIGYEAAARIGLCTRLKPAIHSHGTWGIVGAAVAVARLKGFDADRMFKAITLAAGLATATSRTSPTAGANVRHIYAGTAARNGTLACFLAENGFDGEPNAVEITFGDILGSFDPRADGNAWAESWLIDSNYFKFAASCKDTQGSLAALAAVAEKVGDDLSADNIKAIRIETFADAVTMAETRTGSTIESRFSIPFVLATKLVRGSASVNDFGPEARADSRIIDLANRVTVVEDPVFTEKVPLSYTRIIVNLADGTRLSEELEGSLGDHDKPLDPELHGSKFRELTTRILGKPDETLAICMSLTTSTELHQLSTLLRS